MIGSGNIAEPIRPNPWYQLLFYIINNMYSNDSHKKLGQMLVLKSMLNRNLVKIQK